MAITWMWRDKGEPVHVSLAGGTLTLSLGGKANLSFDGEGRLIGAWLDGITYRRALDNQVLAKWVDRQPRRRRLRRFLDGEERRRVLECAYGMARQVARALVRGRLGLGDTDPVLVERVTSWLDRVGSWSYERLEEERERFQRVYRPVSILPPDQYLALVVQATEGCSYNLCTFCTFYRDRPFRIKTLPQLEQHVERVRDFLGRGITVRRTLFLADANAVIIGQRLLLPTLDVVNRAFPVRPRDLPSERRAAWIREHPWHLRGIYAFISAPDALRKSADDFRELRARNLHRVYVGLETGHDPLRAFIRKGGSAAQVQEAVRTIKAGGVSVGLIFMVGIGGDRYREAHFRDTVEVIQRMPLDAGDLVYISPFVASPGAPYVHDVAAAGIRPLSEEEMEEEERRFRAALRPWARARGVRVSHYDVREFVY